MNIIRLSTAGSVDDGKSTFIGRLLHDTASLPKDKIAQIEAVSRKRGLKEVDLSLITDGLTAEREQGITIDVAHIYFATEKRKYIIADTPGHVEYTRNMITGASNAQVFMILIDARNGIVEQTKRHLFIASLMEINEIMFVINKMDLVDHSEEVYESLLSELKPLCEKFNLQDRNCTFFPISAKYGDHVVKRSEKMNWYTGPTVIEHLETIEDTVQEELPFRYNVQYVIRPHSDEHHDFRGYAGKVVSGIVRLGDMVAVAASGQKSRVKSIHRYKEELLSAKEGDSVVIQLADDIDVSRGDILQATDKPLESAKLIQSQMCWLNVTPLNIAQKYILRQGAFSTQVKINAVETQLDFEALQFKPTSEPLKVNGIGEVSLKTAAPVLMDTFRENPRNGAFVLVDPISNATVAVGFKNN